MIKFIYLFFLIGLMSCSTSKFYSEAIKGDLIFVEAKKENLSGAISRVTSNNNQISFDHLGIIEVHNKTKYLMHSAPKNGSERIKLKPFIRKNKKDKRTQELYRLKEDFQSCIPSAIAKAKTMLGKPYNPSYILNENEYYCSDFVERAFRDCSIFKLQAMTFINPKTRLIDDYWKNFYQNLNMEVPEGQLGCNPNGLSKSDKIYKVKTLYP